MISTASLPTNSDHKDSAPQAPSKTAEFVQDKDENVDLLNGQPHCSVTKLDKWNLMKVRVGFDVTRKGERSLVIDGYKFTKSRDGMSDRVFWRCSRRECKATAVTVGGRVEHVRILHTHKPPTPGEFFSSAAATTTTTEATTQMDTLGRSNSSSRVKRRSHRQQQLQPQTAKSVSEMGGKDSNSHTSAVAAILSDFVEQRQAEKKLEEPNNDHQNVQGSGFLVTGQHHTPQLLSATTFSHNSAQKYSPFTEIDNRGLSALADAAAHQSKRDSQNSTPDPPCEAPGASPSPRQPTPLAHLSSPLPSERGISATTALSGQLVLLGPRGLSAPSLLVGSSSDVPFFSTPSYLSSCTRRFSVSEMPISARTNLQKSLFQTGSSVTRSPIAPISVANSMEPPNRGPTPTMLPSNASTSSGGVGMLLHWKKEKMLESKAEEEMKQHRRRRHFTGSSFAVAPPDDVPAAGAPDAALVTINDEDDASPTLSVKRKRCASAGHPFVSSTSSSCSLLAAAALPSTSGMNDSLTAVSPQSTPGGGGTDQEPASDWCARVQSDLLTQVFTTLQQLAARLGADYEADSVVANCRAIQACLDTISAIKRARQEVSNTSRTP